MVVASKSATHTRRRKVSPIATVTSSHIKAKTLELKQSNSSDRTVTILPSSQATPPWLSRLGIWQQRVSVVTFVLVATTLAAYGWTVYDQHSWNQAYRKLVLLQRNERQLTTESEELKQHIARQAEKPEMGLTPPDPAQVIFLPEPKSSNITVPPTKPPSRPQQPILTPLGY
ncbi:MAG: hypothetical protein JOZ78_24390 [Chroococcidiopsidaceae cyanobacterium CP_BM_ER_R8_30]|nr:hypothetical protein [Chroococcidiopsidaceae cyanobacterium CP_BM_ER_R8_30]